METHDSTPFMSEQSNSKIHKHTYSSGVEIFFVPMLDLTTIWYFKYEIQVLYPASFGKICGEDHFSCYFLNLCQVSIQ